MKLPNLPSLPEVKKALTVLAVLVPTAVVYGFIDSATAGTILGVIGVATTGVVWWIKNEKPAATAVAGPSLDTAPVEPAP